MTRHLASAQYWAGLAGGDTGRLFLTFGGPVRADRISYCPLDRVLTYKNLIYLLNLQFTLLASSKKFIYKLIKKFSTITEKKKDKSTQRRQTSAKARCNK